MDITSAKTKSQRLQLAIRLSLPAILENLLITMVEIVDTAMVGSLGAKATAAVALVSSPIWVILALSAGINSGCSVLVAHYIGAKDRKGANIGAMESLILGLGFGFLAFAVMFLLSPMIPVWMGGAPDVVPVSTTYLRIVCSAYPLYLTGLILCGALRGSGDTRTPMRITAAANILNVIGNFLLIYPTRTMELFGTAVTIPGAGLGVRGAAIATAVATAISGVAAIVVLCSKKKEFHFDFSEGIHLKAKDMREVWNVGMPAALERSSINLGQVFYIRIVSSLGTVMMASHQIAVTAEAICYQPGYGIQAAGTTLTGQAIGARDEDLADNYAKIIIWLGIAVMTFNAVLMFVFAKPFINMFTPDPDVRINAAHCLRMVAFAQPFFAMYIVGTGVLRGLCDAKITVPIAIGCMWCIRIPAAFIMVILLHMGLNGAWLALCGELWIRGSIALGRLYSGKWRALYHKEFGISE